MIAESDNAEALMTWTQGWTDVISFDIAPVIEDEGAARVLSA
ncbi:MAG: DUF3303 family protein [Opitutales bacterium]|jgi:hypothetical protein|nr:DUF3303 family protein [Opitutales bacterium]